MFVQFIVAHTRLPRQPFGTLPSQRLETCWTCGKPLECDGKRWLLGIHIPLEDQEMTDPGEAVIDCDPPLRNDGDYPNRSVEVCSEACVTAERKMTFGKLAEATPDFYGEPRFDYGHPTANAAMRRLGQAGLPEECPPELWNKEAKPLPLPIHHQGFEFTAKRLEDSKAVCPTCQEGLPRAGETYNATTLPKSDWIGDTPCGCEWSVQLVLPSGLRYGEAQKCCLPRGHEGPCKSATNVIKGKE